MKTVQRTFIPGSKWVYKLMKIELFYAELLKMTNKFGGKQKIK